MQTKKRDSPITCNCDHPGYCDTHKRKMSKLSHDQCRGTHGPGYFEAFQLDLQRGNNVEPVIPPAPKSQIGTNLRAIIARELPGVMTCETCAEMIVKLNNMTRDEVLEDIDNIVSEQAS